MAVNEELLSQVRTHLTSVETIAGTDQVEERRIVGGRGLFWRGHLVCGVMGTDLVLRIGATDHEQHLGEDDSRAMEKAGRVSKSWVLLPESSARLEPVLAKWVGFAVAYVETLPAR